MATFRHWEPVASVSVLILAITSRVTGGLSWIWLHIVDGYYDALLPELQGALVDNADISGRVAGKGAAIYISPNALVGNINILTGARLEGDIYSDYAQRDDYGQQRLTLLTFGRKANAYGQATEAADADFSFTYRGNIEGINNLALDAHGGKPRLMAISRFTA